MPLYRISVTKQLVLGSNRQRWDNVYRADVPDVDAAITVGELCWAAEANVTKEYVDMVRISAIQDSPLAAAGRSRSYSSPGIAVGDETLRLPLFNAVRVVLSDDVGRPDQKYLRLPLQEDDIANGVIGGPLMGELETAYANVLLLITSLRSSNGVSYTSAVPQSAIQMRQTGWHRRTRPGFRRGWVPV